MICNLVGYRKISFVDKETGELVEGTSLFVTYPEDGVAGEFAGKIFVRKDRMELLGASGFIPQEGTKIDVAYRQKNRIDTIKTLKQ